MEYRHVGRSGLQLSVFSLGSWLTFGSQLNVAQARECMAMAYDAGVNFFDNAEVYAHGTSEVIMGQAIEQLRWPRHTYVVSSKYYWGIEDSVNTQNTLNRKYLLQAVEGSLRRLGLEFLDIAYCHRPDPTTPVEETVWAMHTIIESGRALYWGTSEWPASAIQEAWDIAERHHLHKPIVEQPEYNLLHRDKVEREFAPLYDRIGLGLTIWSPLASGVLTGKYLNGVPSDSRAGRRNFAWILDSANDPAVKKSVASLLEIAGDLNCTAAQLALAWCANNPHVTTVITGASRPEQVAENLAALGVLPLLRGDVTDRLNALFTA